MEEPEYPESDVVPENVDVDLTGTALMGSIKDRRRRSEASPRETGIGQHYPATTAVAHRAREGQQQAVIEVGGKLHQDGPL